MVCSPQSLPTDMQTLFPLICLLLAAICWQDLNEEHFQFTIYKKL